MDLSNYRVDTLEWIDEYVLKNGSKQFWDYYDKITRALEMLQPGHFYEIDKVADDEREFFVKFCCLYIQRSGGMSACGIGFSSDFSRIKRYHQPLTGLSIEEQLKIIAS